MKPSHAAGAVAGLLALAALFYFYGGSRTPPGQPPLHSLTAENAVDLKNDFNAARAGVRVLLLLSPT